MIELKHITKIFQEEGRATTALSDVSLKVSEGKIVGVIGESGAGKSTLIRCVNLLECPTSGEVYVDGDNLMLLSSSELTKARRNIGMIFQHFNLLASRTVSENIAFPLELDTTPKTNIKARVEEILYYVGFEWRNDTTLEKIEVYIGSRIEKLYNDMISEFEEYILVKSNKDIYLLSKENERKN